jgi:protein-tyrosine phosphatase
MEESLGMCRLAHQDGIGTVVAVAHTLNGVYLNDGETILEAVDAVNHSVRAEGLDLEILPGADTHVDPAVPGMIKDGRVMTVNNNRKSVILEFPDYFVPDLMFRFIETFVSDAILPVISHPERCAQFRDLSVLREVVKRGALTQITAMSLTGDFSQDIQTLTRSFLEEGLVHVIASDAHDTHYRPPILSDALATASEIIGEAEAGLLVSDNPKAIIEGNRPPHLA